jgi:hypothetical protein
MKIISSLKHGLRQVARTKRMILFAWFVNVLFASVLAIPFLNILDGYLRDTVMDEKILQQMDPSWFETFRLDFEKSDLVRPVDYTIFGYAPFLSQLDAVLNGQFVKSAGNFLYNLIFRLEVNPRYASVFVLLGLLYACLTSFLAGGFISMYSKDYRSTFTEFLTDGAKYFGKFFRLALVALLIYYLLFILLFDWISAAIPRWTQNAPSEETSYLYYMVRGVVVLLFLSVLAMIFDYARIRIVVDVRTSALLASLAGARFAFGSFIQTYGLYLLLSFLGVILIAVYALLESQIPQDSYWPLFALFLLQQLYVIARLWVRASFYACQTHYYRERARDELLAQPAAEPPPAS